MATLKKFDKVFCTRIWPKKTRHFGSIGAHPAHQRALVPVHNFHFYCTCIIILCSCNIKPHPHLYTNAEWGRWKWEKCWCGCVSRDATNSIRLCGEHLVNSWMLSIWSRYSKKNTFAMLVVPSSQWMPNKPLFSICSGLLQSCKPCLHSYIDVDIPLNHVNTWTRQAYRCGRVMVARQTVLAHLLNRPRQKQRYLSQVGTWRECFRHLF